MNSGTMSLLQRADQQYDIIRAHDWENWKLSPKNFLWIKDCGNDYNVVCPGCSKACERTAVNTPMGLGILCDETENLGFIAIEQDELKQWTWDWNIFSESLALCFSSKALMIIPNRLWYLGIFQGQKILFARGLDWDDAKEFWEQSTFDIQGAIILGVGRPPNNLHSPFVDLLTVIMIDDSGTAHYRTLS